MELSFSKLYLRFFALYKKARNYHDIIQIFLCILCGLLMIIPFPMPLSIYAIIVFISFLTFVFLQDGNKKSFLIFRLVLLLGGVSFIERLIKGVEYYHHFDVIFPVKAVAYLTTLIVLIVFLFNENEEKEAVANSVCLINILSPAVDSYYDEEGNDTCNIVLCEGKENGKPVYWYGKDRFLHLLILCPTGGGKTALLLLPLAAQDIRLKRGVIAFDPKSDYALKLYSYALICGRQDAQYFDPTSPLCPYYNVLDGDETEVTQTVIDTFLALEASDNQNPYFPTMVKQLLSNACMTIKRIEDAYRDVETGISSRPATLLTLNELVQNVNNRGREMVQELTSLPASDEVMKQNIEIKDWFLNTYWGAKDNTWRDTSNIRNDISQLCQNKYLRKVLNPPNGVSEINFSKILEEGRFLSISLAQGKLGTMSQVLSSFLTLSMTKAIIDRPGNEFNRTPCFLYIDEAQVVCNKQFSIILEQGRSYRVSAHLATQSLDELEIGRDKSLRKTVKNNCRNRVLLAGASYDDAAEFSKLFGLKKKVTVTHSKSHASGDWFGGAPSRNSEGTTEREEDVEYMSADDIVYDDFGMITYQLVSQNTLRRAEKGHANFLDKDEAEKIDAVCNEYIKRNEKLRAEEDAKRQAEENERRRQWQLSKRGGQFNGDGVDASISGSGVFSSNNTTASQVSIDPFGSSAPRKVQPIKSDTKKTDNFFDTSNAAFDYDDDEM